MSLFKRYKAYVKDNPKGYWFKAKLYGWGWVPVTNEGWLLTIGLVIIVLLFALTIDENSTAKEIVFTFLLPITLLVVAFIRIAYKKGEKPSWNWGLKQDKKTKK